jgi:1-deoxy-D-xylulose-5-phosphate synthase
MILSQLNLPDDLKQLNENQLHCLAQEIRSLLIHQVHLNGGHLSSNLGIIELTIALHYVYSFATDRILFDVSHQSYIHKILSGRLPLFGTLRQFQGLSGFTDPAESVYDVVKAGHAGAAISFGVGLSQATRMTGGNEKTVVLIGDASIANGMAFEALNHLGHLKTGLLIILNDNQMSISKTVGAFSEYLSRFLSGSFYHHIKKDIRAVVSKIPMLGESINEALQQFRKTIKKSIVHNIFEELGVRYIGPIDGHDINGLIKTFSNLSLHANEPTLVHVMTQKGKGYPDAEKNPTKFHGISLKSANLNLSYTQVFGNKMQELARNKNNLAIITAAMTDGTGLNRFSELYPEKYFDVGIAEEHAVGFCAGLSYKGIKPYVAIYSTFMQRAVDQLFHEVSLQENINPVFVMDRSGLVGEDGPTHHGIYDIAYTKFLPRFVLMAPKDATELENMLDFAYDLNHPAVIRFAKETCPDCFTTSTPIALGQGEIILESPNAKLTILAYGSMVLQAYLLQNLMDIPFNLINLRFAKPLDNQKILDFAARKIPIVCLEEHSAMGGIGESIGNFLCENNAQVPFLKLGLPDEFVPHGERSLLFDRVGLSPLKLKDRILHWLSHIS